MAPQKLPAALQSSGRATAARVNCMLPGGFVLISIYLSDGLDTDFLEELGVFLQQLDVPWVVAGDWNAIPEELSALGWVQTLGGRISAPDKMTCTMGKGNAIDYFVLNAKMGLLNYSMTVNVPKSKKNLNKDQFNDCCAATTQTCL